MGSCVLISLMPQRVLCADSIGSVTELNGTAQVLRDKPYGAELDFGILSYDKVETADGRMGITFIDETQIRLTENSRVLIDEFIFDPDPDKSKMALTFAKGTARFVTGRLNKVAKKNIKIRTNTATIGIRGTDFTITVDELGRSLIILLPDKLGLSSGEIEVSTGMGTVILNKPFQATTVSAFENMPSNPVILDLTLDLIDNMLIVSEPKEEKEQVKETESSSTNVFLDFNELDVDYLAEDALDDNELEFTELDIDLLQVNFLEDMLNVLDALAVKKEEDQLGLATGIKIVGTEIGQDKDTQITTLIQGQNVSIRRNVGNSLRLDMDGSSGYTLVITQNGVSKVVTINGGSTNTINVTQQ